MLSMTQPTPKLSKIMPRLLTGLILVFGVSVLLMFAPVFWIQLFLVFVLGLAAFEFLNLHAQNRNLVFSQMIFFILLFVGLWAKGILHWQVWFHFALLTSLVVSDFYVTSNPKPLKLKIELLSHVALGLLYLFPAFYYILQLAENADYQFWFFLGIAITATADSFAYFGGRIFGKHPLAPKISPNKTREGAYAAVLGGIVASVILHTIFQRQEAIWQQMLLGFCLAVFGILGDLAESALKRAFEVKDSGNILPGHGGVLDRIDAYLLTLPAIYFYAQWISR